MNKMPSLPSTPCPFDERDVAPKKQQFTGKDVDYYTVSIDEPKRPERPPYIAECEDIIEALNMTFAEGCAFKAIWRSCALREFGVGKKGQDEHGVYDAEKTEYYGKRMTAQRKRKAKKAGGR